MILSLDAERSFDKIQHKSIHDENSKQTRNYRYRPQVDKGHL